MRPPLDGRTPVGRLELLMWVNAALQTDYHRLEELCDGVAYAQLFDAVHPGHLSLARLNLNAQTPLEYERNLGLVKDAFKRASLPVLPQVDKLKTGRLADNQEFTQWLYCHLQEQHVDITKYPAADIRQAALAKQLVAWERQAGRQSGKPPSVRPELLWMAEKQLATGTKANGHPSPNSSMRNQNAHQSLPLEASHDASKERRCPPPPAKSTTAACLQPEERQAVRHIIDAVEGAMVQRLTQQTDRSTAVMALKAEVDALYCQLQAVENICREHPDNAHAAALLTLLTQLDPLL